MATLVFVAGAFHGAWAWRDVCRRLSERGHEAHRLDLTGQGARVHSAGPATGLSTHLLDVVAYVETEELSDVTLVGHSYSGMVITGAAEILGDRVSHLIYLDALVPEDGQSAAAISTPSMISRIVELAAKGDGWSVPCFFPVEKFGAFDPDQERRFSAMLTPHPVRTLFEPVRLKDRFSGKRSFIYCTVDPIGLFDDFARTADASPDWGYFCIATRHDPMITHSEELAEMLAAIVQDDGTGPLTEAEDEVFS